jgi:hypothetical protein
VAREVRQVQEAGTGEIGDACARVIASWWAGGEASPGYAFVSTGAITTDDPADVWRDLCAIGYEGTRGWERAAVDCLGTYLIKRDRRDPVPGWSGLWVR